MLIFVNSETTKNVLVASSYIHLKCPNMVELISELPAVCPRILLSGPEGNIISILKYLIMFLLLYWLILTIALHVFFAGSEMYQDTLTRALANFFGVRLLIVNKIMLSGVSFHCKC